MFGALAGAQAETAGKFTPHDVACVGRLLHELADRGGAAERATLARILSEPPFDLDPGAFGMLLFKVERAGLVDPVDRLTEFGGRVHLAALIDARVRGDDRLEHAIRNAHRRSA